MLRELFDRHLGSLEAVGNVGADHLESLNTTLKRLERFWIDQLEAQASSFGFPPAGKFEPDRWLVDGDQVTVGDQSFPVTEKKALTLPFGTLLHFSK